MFYISGPGYSYEDFAPLIDQVSERFIEILKKLIITTPDGKPVEIKLFIEATTPEKVRAYAVRTSKTPRIYEIRMTAGLSYHLWLASRIFESDMNVLNWIKKIKVTEQRQKNIGRKAILSNEAYFLASYLIVFHEISHVVLGHCDFVQDMMDFESLNEFQDEKTQLTSKEIRIRKAFEAEADRQAGEFLIIFFESSLGERGLGQHIKFPSRIHAYEFYSYAVTLVCILLQQLSQRKGGVHPKPNERQFIIISSISKYFLKYKPDEHDRILSHTTITMVKAAKKMGLIDGGDFQKVMKNATSLAFVDDVINETKIKNYQLIMG